MDMMDDYDDGRLRRRGRFDEDDFDADEPFTLDPGPAPSVDRGPGRRSAPRKRTRRKK